MLLLQEFIELLFPQNPSSGRRWSGLWERKARLLLGSFFFGFFGVFRIRKILEEGVELLIGEGRAPLLKGGAYPIERALKIEGCEGDLFGVVNLSSPRIP
jgi:hypothetical protein